MRLATPDDQNAVVALTSASYAPYTALFGSPPVPVTENYAPRIEAGEIWLLEDSHGLAGLIALERHPDHAMIFSVAIAPDRQGQGQGSRLLHFAEHKAREWGLHELRLYTNARMGKNIAIYTVKGYRETGRRTHPDRPGFTVVDMAKQI